MTTVTPLVVAIDNAEQIAGGMRPLARLLNTNASNLIAMRKGERTCPIGIRARLAEVTGENATVAMLHGLADKLDSTDFHEAQLEVILRATADSIESQAKENPASLSTGGVVWRKRKFTRLATAALWQAARSIDGPLSSVRRAAETLAQLPIRHTASPVFGN